MDTAIFGAGIAGLMTAITLRPLGHRCRVYERNSFGHEDGMGFIMMPRGVDCLQSYGVTLDGIPMDRYFCRDSTGDVLLEQAMPLGTCSLRRSELVASMARAVSNDVDLVFGDELQCLEFDEEGGVAAGRLKSGKLIHADLYVGADGAGSRARNAIYPNWPVSPARVMEIVGMVRCERAIGWAGRHFNKFHSRAGGIALGIVPVDAEHVVWYLQYDSHRFPPPTEPANGINSEVCRAFVQELVGEWPHPVPKLLLATDFSRVHTAKLIDADLVPLFHKGNLVLIGDAAHPLSPFTSQGVSSAIADAVTLAGHLKAHRDLASALAHYSAERREHCSPYLTQGRDLARRFLEPLNPGNAFLPLAQ